MKLKFNWGTGIAITYLAFVIGVLIMVFIFMNQEVSLETKDYYAKGLEYQKQIDKIERTNNLSEQLEISTTENEIIFNFPKIFTPKNIHGEIYFYRPSNSNNDLKVKIDLNEQNIQKFSTSNFPKGLWKIKVDWFGNNQNFYNEKILMIN